jgi:hypothetical protein
VQNDCFLSYASPDLAVAEIVYRQLVAAGFQVWFDKVRLKPGFNWHTEIERACESSRVLLPLLTPRWKLAEWTRYETYGAESVVPLLVEGDWNNVATPPLTRYQNAAMALADMSDANWERLFAEIRNLCARDAPKKHERVAHLQYRPNPFFLGRDRVLNDVHEMLFTRPTTALTQGPVGAVTALGGVGKTAVARHYAEKFWRCYPQMFWVDCLAGIESGFARIRRW